VKAGEATLERLPAPLDGGRLEVQPDLIVGSAGMMAVAHLGLGWSRTLRVHVL
jgi:hypothetical protein